MSTDIVLTVIGILAGVATSFVFFLLSTRKARRVAWRLAKSRITSDLAQSLGQDRVPPREAIVATIGSILREHDVGELQDVAYGEVIEELLRQVTADPFLDRERRLTLQSSLIALQKVPLTDVANVNTLPASAVEYGAEIDSKYKGSHSTVDDVSLYRARLAQFLTIASRLRWHTVVIGITLGMVVMSAIDPLPIFNVSGVDVLGVIDELIDVLAKLLRR